jgi:multidrug efflux pump subunit AcrA (membrane-fusion protein)
MKKTKIKNNKIRLIIILGIISLIIGCQKQATKKEIDERVPVRVARVQLQDIDEALDYSGNIKAFDEAVVYPKVSGKIIEKVKEDGVPITKGETILYIDRDEVGLKFEKAPVESPITGIVGRIYVDKGENVNSATPVALVVNMDKVKIDFNVPEVYLPRVTLAQKAKITLDAYPQELFLGEITKISPVLDLDTRAAPVEITVDNSGHKLNSGMFARVRLILDEHKEVPVVIKEAILGHEPGLFVYVIENNKAKMKKVKLGLRQGPYYEVTEGFKEGEKVVILGQQKLSEGREVIIEENNR